MLYLHFTAAAIACGGCPLFHQATTEPSRPGKLCRELDSSGTGFATLLAGTVAPVGGWWEFTSETWWIRRQEMASRGMKIATLQRLGGLSVRRRLSQLGASLEIFVAADVAATPRRGDS
jgi:hypothetical protein